MRRAFIHLGPHKTGSTSFQEMLAKNEQGLNSKGVGFICQWASNRKKHLEWRGKYSRDLRKGINDGLDIADLVNNLRPHFRHLISWADSYNDIIISDENILGWPLGHYILDNKNQQNFAFYPAAQAVFRALRLELSAIYDDVSFCVINRKWE